MITTAVIKSLLLPGLDAIFGDYDQLPTEWKEIYSVNNSEMYREIDVEVKLLGLAQLKNEAQGVAYEDMGERYSYTYYHKGVGLGFIISKFAIRDNLYKAEFGPSTQALKHSFAQTKEVYGAAVLNNAFDSTNFPGGDGVSLCNTAHPIDLGTIANTFTTQQELNETSLQDATVGIRRFKDAAGLRSFIQPKKLIIPPELQFVAERLLKTDLRVGTSDNDLNALRSLNLIPKGFAINDFLTNTKGWFVVTNCPNGMKYFQRDAFETDMYEDFDTSSLKVKGEERYSFGWSNVRGIWGANP